LLARVEKLCMYVAAVKFKIESTMENFALGARIILKNMLFLKYEFMILSAPNLEQVLDVRMILRCSVRVLITRATLVFAAICLGSGLHRRVHILAEAPSSSRCSSRRVCDPRLLIELMGQSSILPSWYVSN
jgi:hypothetical protein